MPQWQDIRTAFREIYGPALVGGVFLCIADLMQSDKQGQIFKLGGVIKRNFLAGFGAEEPWIGVVLILTLGLLLCFVSTPKSASDSFAKGASVFAVLAALVPTNRLPGTPISLDTSPDAAQIRFAQIETDPLASGSLQRVLLQAIPSARAQTVIPVTPTARARITLLPAPNTSREDFFRQIQESGIDVWLIDKTGNAVAYERIKQAQFTLTKPPGDYVIEVAMEGYRRVRAPITLGQELQVYDLVVGEKTNIPIGLQQLYGPNSSMPIPNRRETFKYSGAELSRRGSFAEAVAFYDKALSSDPQDKETLNFKGYALYKMGRYDEAARSLEAAIRIDRSYFVARLNAAKVACRRGRVAEAREAVFGAPPLAAPELAVILADGEFATDCRALAAELKEKRK
jgi:tetratricopeptide repeat protein